jgi:hypothetical protein
MQKVNIIPDNIVDYLEYNESSSTCLVWKKQKPHTSNKVGDECGCLNKRGYYIFCFDGKYYTNHRVIFFMFTGQCPEVVDHIDTNRTNNKIDNLRPATHSQSACNTKRRSVNKTGIKGLSIVENKYGSYWRLGVQINGKDVLNTMYKKDKYTIEQVEEIIRATREKYHGSFANHG